MNVVICSAFRNAGHLIENYFNQIDALASLLNRRGDWLSLVLGYGDSDDGTGELLFEAAANSIGARLIDVSHGGQAFGSIVNAQRFRQLAYIGNKILANVPFEDADAVIWLESDLIWAPEVIAELLNHLQWHACVAPMIMDSNGTTFYDTFVFRRSGICFVKQPPYHPCMMASDHMIEMDSVGSCVVMRADAIKGVTVPEEDVLVGVCRQIKERGGRVWLDSNQKVYHP